jgi:para-nitrobenzyl esterase
MWATIGGVQNSSEDCLFLNVYAPVANIPTRPTTTVSGGTGTPLLPVLVYFPAGQFMWGSGNDAENYNAPQTAAGAQMIVVTMNYRLGAAGSVARVRLRGGLFLVVAHFYH